MSHIEPDSVVAQGGHPLSAELRASGVADVRSCDLGWGHATVPPAVLIAYDLDTFAVDAFARHAIEMPASIARSVKKRQGEFFMGRLAAAAALGHPWTLAGMEAFALPIGTSRQPVWPEGVVGSITHAGPYAAAVAVKGSGITGIGIDIEQRIGAETRQSVEATVLDTTEQALLHTPGHALPYEMLLTLVFSAKESFFKGTFATVGTYFDFDAVVLTALDVAGGTLELTLARTLAAPLPEGRRFMLRHCLIDADTLLTSFVW